MFQSLLRSFLFISKCNTLLDLTYLICLLGKIKPPRSPHIPLEFWNFGICIFSSALFFKKEYYSIYIYYI